MLKSTNRISVAVLGALIAATPVVAMAAHDPAEHDAKPHHTFDDIDTNKDGMISRAEFDAAHAKKDASAATKAGEMKCGEGKCADLPKPVPTTTAAPAAKAGEMKCGEGKCGGAAPKKPVKP